jgi:hypothetical protein
VTSIPNLDAELRAHSACSAVPNESSGAGKACNFSATTLKTGQRGLDCGDNCESELGRRVFDGEIEELPFSEPPPACMQTAQDIAISNAATLYFSRISSV